MNDERRSAVGILLRELVRELDALATDVDSALADIPAKSVRESLAFRRMYRRGYFTGYAAGKRHVPAEANPERQARGENARLMGFSPRSGKRRS